ncbi:MAG: GNAT family N-acetyltransferase [Dehalococcoidales bacterium]|nr:GNAT family N-acetyltransferase [Dehalococcoidales bacterium]
MKTVIRPARQTDKNDLVFLLKNISQFEPYELTVAQELIDEYLCQGTSSGYYILVALEADVLAGYICYGPTPLTESTWDIYWEAVSPTLQGKGIGRALIESAEANICAIGGHLILIETSSSPAYENTRKFYVSNGYQLASCIPDFYAPNDDRLTYCKKL